MTDIFATVEREQHDDHCWVTVHGEGWCIRAIERHPRGWQFALWRGHAPKLEHAVLSMPANWDMKAYAEKAASLLDTEFA